MKFGSTAYSVQGSTNTISLADSKGFTDKPIFGYMSVPSVGITMPIFFLRTWSGTFCGNGYWFTANGGASCSFTISPSNKTIKINDMWVNGTNYTTSATLVVYCNA